MACRDCVYWGGGDPEEVVDWKVETDICMFPLPFAFQDCGYESQEMSPEAGEGCPQFKECWAPGFSDPFTIECLQGANNDLSEQLVTAEARIEKLERAINLCSGSCGDYLPRPMETE